MLVQYVKFFYESTDKLGGAEIVRLSPEGIPIPECCYAYQTFSREEIDIGDEMLIGKQRNISSPIYFGNAYLYCDLKDPEKHKELAQERRDFLMFNSEYYEWERIGICRTLNCFRVGEHDKVIPIKDIPKLLFPDESS